MSVNLTDLEQQRNELQEQLVAIDQGKGDASTRQNVLDQLNAVTNKIEEEKYNNKIAAQTEEVQNTITTTVDEITIDGMSLRDLIVNSTTPELAVMAYQAISVSWKQSMMDITKDVQTKMQADYDSLYETTSSLRTELVSAKTELSTNKLSLEDAEAKRDAAAQQLDEANKEIERLNSQVDDLRKEIAVGAANATKVVDTTATLEAWKAAKAAADAAKPAIYDVQAADTKQSRFTAKLASTDEVIEFGYLEKGKYREVTADEAATFRAEYLAQQEQTEHNQTDTTVGDNTDLTLPAVPQFQDGEDQPVNGVDQADVNRTLETTATGAIETRLAQLEQRVTALEQQSLQQQGSAA